MEKYIKEKLNTSLSNFCCSQCKAEFDNECVKIISREKGLFVTNLICKNCGKDFGITLLKLNNAESLSEPFEIIEGSEVIGMDDVIDAHKFIRDLDEHWQDHLPEI